MTDEIYNNIAALTMGDLLEVKVSYPDGMRTFTGQYSGNNLPESIFLGKDGSSRQAEISFAGLNCGIRSISIQEGPNTFRLVFLNHAIPVPYPRLDLSRTPIDDLPGILAQYQQQFGLSH